MRFNPVQMNRLTSPLVPGLLYAQVIPPIAYRSSYSHGYPLSLNIRLVSLAPMMALFKNDL